MIRGISHAAISTSDKVSDNIVGFDDSSARIVMLKAANACVELFEYRAPEPKPSEPLRPLCDHSITQNCLKYPKTACYR